MKITIITPTLNCEKTILDTLDSVSCQTYKNIEHLIIDGGSQDETLNILKNYKRKKIKIFRKKQISIKQLIMGLKDQKVI